MTLEESANKRWNDAISGGTPKTLQEAISNGFKECSKRDLDAAIQSASKEAEIIINRHIKDFLAQKFQLFMNGSGDAVDTCSIAIWNKIMSIKE